MCRIHFPLLWTLCGRSWYTSLHAAENPFTLCKLSHPYRPCSGSSSTPCFHYSSVCTKILRKARRREGDKCVFVKFCVPGIFFLIGLDVVKISAGRFNAYARLLLPANRSGSTVNRWRGRAVSADESTSALVGCYACADGANRLCPERDKIGRWVHICCSAVGVQK